MSFSFFDRLAVRQIMTLLLLSGALLTMFPHAFLPYEGWADRVQWVAAAYLIVGLFFLVINRVRLMFVCFGCSAAISFFYHEAKPDTLPGPPPVEQNTPPRGNKSSIFDPNNAPSDSLQ